MLKNAIIVSFVFLVLGKLFLALGWEIWFKIDQVRITRELCENKAIPMLHCNGKCYLAKKLKQIESDLTKNSSSKKNNPFVLKVEYQFQKQVEFSSEIKFEKIDTLNRFPIIQIPKLVGYFTKIDHPPCFSII